MSLELEKQYYTRFAADLVAFKEYSKSHLGLVITLIYFVFCIAGIIYLSKLLGHFGLSAFNHIELSDFLLAALANGPLLASFCIFIFFMSIHVYLKIRRLDKPVSTGWFSRAISKLNAPFYKVSPVIGFTAIFVFALFFYSYTVAGFVAEEIVLGHKRGYDITLNYPIKIKETQTSELQKVNIVTSTTSNLFVYDGKVKRLLIIPHANVAALVPELPRTRKQSALTQANTAERSKS